MSKHNQPLPKIVDCTETMEICPACGTNKRNCEYFTGKLITPKNIEFPLLSINCLDCGFKFYNRIFTDNLENVNSKRKKKGLNPLEKFKKQHTDILHAKPEE